MNIMNIYKENRWPQRLFQYAISSLTVSSCPFTLRLSKRRQDVRMLLNMNTWNAAGIIS
jgi:hypothetical protein